MYAAKMADLIDIYLRDAQQILGFSATSIQQHYSQNALSLHEAERLIQQNRYFNSIIMADEKGEIIASAPASLNLTGKRLNTVGAKQSLRERTPLISDPFYSAMGNYIISISTPVFDQEKNYLGFISGTLHLKHGNILSELLSQHFIHSKHQIYIYDSNGIVLYHSQPTLIGKTISTLTDADEAALFFHQNAGTAKSTQAHWQIVVERSVHDLQQALQSQIMSATYYLLPASFLLAICIWWLGAKLSAPLSQFVKLSNDFTVQQNRDAFRRIHSPITEIQQLKRALLRRTTEVQQRLSHLDKVSQTDPLTKIANRRGLEHYAASITSDITSRVILAIDIDHFKQVNDNYGHDFGDLVLKKMASILCQNTRAEDLVCRVGGEEFLIITAHPIDKAAELAERIRATIASFDFELLDNLTISIGVSLWHPKATPLDMAIKNADIALYLAKHNGRNRVVINQDYELHQLS